METFLKLFAGAAGGAMAGFLLGIAVPCSAEACNIKARRIAAVVAGAIFGAAVAWYMIHR